MIKPSTFVIGCYIGGAALIAYMGATNTSWAMPLLATLAAIGSIVALGELLARKG